MLRRDLKNTTKDLIAQAKRAIASGKVKQECHLSISGVTGSPIGASEEGENILARQASMRERAGWRTSVETAGTLSGTRSRRKN
jgi:hypothetical protein